MKAPVDTEQAVTGFPRDLSQLLPDESLAPAACAAVPHVRMALTDSLDLVVAVRPALGADNAIGEFVGK